MALTRALWAVAMAAPALVSAGPGEEFLVARFQYGIEGASTTQDLKDLKADGYIELKGKVSGSIKSADGTVTFIVRFGELSEMVDSRTVPAWTGIGVTDVRMILMATKLETQLIPKLELVASLPEADMPALEEKYRAEADRRAAEQRRMVEDTRKKIMSEGDSIGVEGLLTSPPPGSTFRGSINGGRSAIAKELQALVPQYVAVIVDNNKGLPSQTAQLIAESILAYASAYGVDARLIMAVVKHESNFNPQSTSHVGAQGLGQLMPETSRSLGISDPYDIVQNIYGTVRTLRGHLERQGKVSRDNYELLVRALACYNAGPGAVEKYGGLPPYAETEAYVERVIRTYFQLSGHTG